MTAKVGVPIPSLLSEVSMREGGRGLRILARNENYLETPDKTKHLSSLAATERVVVCISNRADEYDYFL